MVSVMDDFPIDPALLAEEAGMRDADGEADGDFEVDEHATKYPYSQIQVASPRRGRPPKQPVASSSRLPDTTPQPPVQRKKPGPKPGSKRTWSVAPKNKLGRVNGNSHGHGHGHGGKHASMPTLGRTSSVETVYAHPRDDYCSFCSGGISANKLGQPEPLVSCFKCGQSGHPSCCNMYGRLAKVVFTYNWACMNCKVCEVCNQKGDDDDMMFCDGCDKGYHYYCCNPPLPAVPKGKFLCDPCREAVERRRLQKASFSLPSARHPPDQAVKYHPPPLAETPTAARKGRPSKAVQASRRTQHELHASVPEDDLFTSRPRIKIKGRDKGKGRQVDNSPGYVVKIRVPSGGRSKTVDIEEEEEKVPYGGVITGDDADTSRTTITESDKERFEKSLKAAESRLGGPTPQLADYDPHSSTRGSPAPSSINGYTPRASTPNLSKSTSTPMLARGLRDRVLQQAMLATPGNSSTPNGLASGSTSGPVASTSEKIKTIRFGEFDIDTWYSAPYPEEYQNVPDGRLWLCEFCLKYMKSGFVAGRHRTKCKTRHPPGDEIYRDGAISVFEVDGRKNKIYCQNLCLLAKMFLDHKTLYYDVEPFLFYVMTEVDELGARFVGYFSKEKRSIDNNVSCIMTLPVRQRKGWGQLLIDFSYALSRKEGRVGSPEKPLSGLGEVTYKRYWKIKVFEHLRSAPDTVTMDDISAATCLTLADIYTTLTSEDMIVSLDPSPETRPIYTPSRARGRRGRGRGSVQRRSSHRDREDTHTDASDSADKPAIPTRYVLKFDRAYIAAILDQYESKGHLTLKYDRLKYHPFLVSRDPVKPPGTIAKTTLMANHSEEQDEIVVPALTEPEEVINHGEDRATLELVAKLSGTSPIRSLRKRPGSSAPNSEESQRRTRQRSKSGVLDTPRRSTRGVAGGVADSPLRAVNANGGVNGDVEGDEDGEWEEDEDMDAEGEEYLEE